MVYPPELAKELVRRWPRGEPVPYDRLRVLLEVAWSATLLEEEGRRPVFTLAYTTTAEAHRFGTRVEEFRSSVPLTAQAVAKLAPATDRRETVLAVSFEGDAPAMWGLIHVGNRRFQMDELEIRPPLSVEITGFRPGGVLVDACGQRLLRYVAGSAHWYSHDDEDLTKLLHEVLHPTANETLRSSGGALAHEFERVAERLVLAGHGGTILIWESNPPRDRPAGVTIPPSKHFRMPSAALMHAFQEDERLHTGQHDDVPREHLSRRQAEAERTHAAALSHVARLANVDGAVLIHPDLRVLGFGVTIQMGDVEPKVFNGRDERLPLPSRGHRHKSAAHFCAMQGDQTLALAIVVSQDGDLTLFARTRDDRVAHVSMNPRAMR